MDRFLPPQPWEELSPFEEALIEAGGSYADLEEEAAEAEVDRYLEERSLRRELRTPDSSNQGGE